MEQTVETKSFLFAVRIVKLCQYLRANKKEFTLSKQLLRSGTSIGANIAESQQAQSRADFISKLQISLKETAETEYWLRLLVLSGYLPKEAGDSLIADCLELKRILIASLNTAKKQA